MDLDAKGASGDPARRYYYSGAATWFITNMTDPPWPPTAEDTVVFFDTDDGLPCNGPDGDCDDPLTTNATTLTFTGGSNCGTGVLVVMGDFNAKGSGTCSWSAKPPPDCDKMGGPCTDPTVISGGFWEGYIWVGGEFDWNGAKKLYGTLSAGSVGSGSGALEIWYKTGSRTLGYLGQSVFIKYWRERKPENWDVFP